MEMNKAFLVVIGSELFGDSFGVVRSCSDSILLVEMSYRPPVGTTVTVHFQNVRDDSNPDEIVARATVDRYLETGSGMCARARGSCGRLPDLVRLRIVEFVATQAQVAEDRIQ